ncbi:branched-chain amino acid ABC transporter permease [Limosilactobacillus gastricus]|uniref:Azaleucine resistance protein AzlC n=1 Tax=Limosilactobacillus gastricus DSM 16045 TaxID=1423749 RepID=A0A0R1VHC9_9LACO|nr:Azaleucine resistance protein AzlC [Limosilactobacillus gastricus DSM 16045]QGF40218.1 branched-chain amino acid ABC transporter permease [Limosilactobacillus gastricus]
MMREGIELEWKYAFKKSFPVMIGYVILAVSYGLYMHNLHFDWWFPLLMAATIYGGSVEFLIANMLLLKFAPVTVLLITLVVGFRQFFYGIAMLDRYHGQGWQKWVQILGLSDETFAVNLEVEVPEHLDQQLVYSYISIYDYLAWVFGAGLGGVLGQQLAIQINGLDFIMTALFIVLALEQILKESNHISSISGFIITAICLLAIGQTYFLLLALLLMVIEYTWLYRRLQRRAGGNK